MIRWEIFHFLMKAGIILLTSWQAHAKPHWVQTLCESNKSVLILDNFYRQTPDYGSQMTKPLFDIDGDAIADVEHGDIVKLIANSNFNDIKTYGLNRTNNHNITTDDIASALIKIIELIDTNKMQKPSALLMSIGMFISFDKLNKELRLNDAINPENLMSSKRKALQRILELNERVNKTPFISKTAQLIQLTRKINELGIEFVVAGGNHIPSHKFNFYSLLKIKTVGALTFHGKEVAPYSHFHEDASVYVVGDIVVRRLENGIDLNNDGEIDVTTNELSWEEPIVNKYRGREVNGSVKSEEEWSFISEGVFYFSILNEVAGYRYNEMQGDATQDFAITYGEWVVFPGGFHLKKDSQENYRYDPSGDGNPNQVSTLRGTSYATPNLCQ